MPTHTKAQRRGRVWCVHTAVSAFGELDFVAVLEH